jgi:RNA polymerase sigma-70 factor, ECF subfamily
MDDTRMREELFTQLFRQYAARVFYFLKKHVKREDLAEDLMQEIFANIWKKMDSLVVNGTANETIDAYLFTAARNHLYNYLEKTLKEDRRFLPLEHLDSSGQSTYSHIEEHIAVKELAAEFGTILDSLSPQRKKAFELSREYNLSYYEIAVTMGIAPRTVEKHVSAALKTLRSRMTALAALLSLFIIW